MIGSLATTIMAPPAVILASLRLLKPTGFKSPKKYCGIGGGVPRRLWHAVASVARRHAVAAAHATAATCAGPQRGAEGRVLPFLCHPGQAPLAQSETAEVSGGEVMPVDTSIHEGLQETQDPSSLATGSLGST